MVPFFPFSNTLTISERYLPLGELCARLEKAENARIVCVPNIKDRKIALFCVNKSADEIRRMVATATGLRWRKTSDRLLLEVDPELEKRERES